MKITSNITHDHIVKEKEVWVKHEDEPMDDYKKRMKEWMRV